MLYGDDENRNLKRSAQNFLCWSLVVYELFLFIPDTPLLILLPAFL